MNLKEYNNQRLQYVKNLPLKYVNISKHAKALIRKGGHIATIGDLLETSSLDLFHILGDDYVLYKETKDLLKEQGIELFSHNSPQAKMVREKYNLDTQEK